MVVLKYRGRMVTDADVAFIRQLIAAHPSWNRLIGFSPVLEAACACGAGGGFRVQPAAPSDQPSAFIQS